MQQRGRRPAACALLSCHFTFRALLQLIGLARRLALCRGVVLSNWAQSTQHQCCPPLQVEFCSRKDNHDWATCPYAHDKEKAKRRDPACFNYASLPCPNTMQVCDRHGRTLPAWRCSPCRLQVGCSRQRLDLRPNTHPCPPIAELQGRSCPGGDACPYTHSVQEYWLHPDRFKTQMCKNGSSCTRPLCFFAHK
jgi:hypothetical protein